MMETLLLKPPVRTTATISMLVVEDDPLLRALLVDTLKGSPGVQVLGSVGSGPEVMEAVERLNPGIVLLDLQLPGTNTLSLLQKLSGKEHGPAVLALGAEDDAMVQLQAARNGARGYVPKSEAFDSLARAIRGVAELSLWFPPDVLKLIYEDYRNISRKAQEEQRPLNRLTERERDVLMGVARGLTNKQIGTELFMSVHTVKLHVQNILKKTGLPNRTEAAVLAVREGLLDDDPTPTLSEG
jgi:two-component system nitrate/nitrite response regulator NarL